MPQVETSFTATVQKTVGLRYLLHLPRAYSTTTAAAAPWPVILFLHGAGERGADLSAIKVHGIPKIAANDPDFPFIAISPQCPANSWWLHHFDDLIALLDQVLETHHADRSRVYLTGMSMGGNGSFGLANRHPERFAALAPICAHDLFLHGLTHRQSGVPYDVSALTKLPTWVFHGAADPVVPVLESTRIVQALQAAGGDVRFTCYPLADHDSWSETYANPELYQWMLSHKRACNTAP